MHFFKLVNQMDFRFKHDNLMLKQINVNLFNYFFR